MEKIERNNYKLWSKISIYKSFFVASLFLLLNSGDTNVFDGKYDDNNINKKDSIFYPFMGSELIVWWEVCDINNINVIANTYIRESKYNEAIELLLSTKDSLLNKWIDEQDQNILYGIYSNLWNLYTYIQDDKQSIEYHFKAINISKSMWNKTNLLDALNNLAATYLNYLQQPEKAIPLFLEAEQIIKENWDIFQTDYHMKYFIYSWLSNSYIWLWNYSEAKIYFNKAKKILTEHPISSFEYACLLTSEADFYIQEKNYKEAFLAYEEALKLSKESNDLGFQEWITKTMKNLALSLKDYNLAYDYQRQHFAITDSIKSLESEKQRAEIETKYWVLEKEREIEKQQAEIAIQQQKTKTARTVWWLAIALAAVLWWAGMMLRRKNKQLNEKNQIITEKNDQLEEKNQLITEKNQEITQKNSELEQAYEEVRATNDQLEEKNQLITEKNDELQDANQEITKQKTIIEKQHHDTLSSINYAADIQKHILSTNNFLSQHFPKSFVYRNPKDIVSGDFYLASEASNGQKVLIASDCTWHGVPAALLTVLGKIALQEWIKQSSTPWELLNYIHKFFKDQNRTHEETQSLSMWYVTSNALDIATVYFDPETKVLRASTSSKPILILRWNEIIRLSPSIRAEIWSLVTRKGFTWYETMEYQLQEGDNIFLFSDGIVDQFDGIRDKKFGMRKLSELLKQLITMPIEQRTWYLYKFFEKYRTKEDGSLCIQTDDMILLWFTV